MAYSGLRYSMQNIENMEAMMPKEHCQHCFDPNLCECSCCENNECTCCGCGCCNIKGACEVCDFVDDE